MIKFNECELKIIFKYSKCNEKFMEVRVGDTLLDPQDGYATYTGLLELPAQVTITTSGKNHRYDTKVDESGNICEDLAVQIESIKLDSFDLNDKYIHQKINILTESGETHTTSYIGFNGTININFDENNVFAQILKANN
jgi:hypothetical protein